MSYRAVLVCPTNSNDVDLPFEFETPDQFATATIEGLTIEACPACDQTHKFDKDVVRLRKL